MYLLVFEQNFLRVINCAPTCIQFQSNLYPCLPRFGAEYRHCSHLIYIFVSLVIIGVKQKQLKISDNLYFTNKKSRYRLQSHALQKQSDNNCHFRFLQLVIHNTHKCVLCAYFTDTWIQKRLKIFHLIWILNLFLIQTKECACI